MDRGKSFIVIIMNDSELDLGERERVEAHVDAIVEDREILELLHLLRGVLALAKRLAVFVHLFSGGRDLTKLCKKYYYPPTPPLIITHRPTLCEN